MPVVNIQFTLFSAFYTPIIATMASGFLEREGLDYQWSIAPPGKSAVDAIEDGSADVIQTALIQAVNDLEQGRKPEAINFATVNAMDGFFISAREADAQFEWKKLEGAEVVMFAGGQPNYMFRYACHRAGIDYDKIIPITPGGPADIDRAYREGQGQYVQQQGPFPQQLAAEHLGQVIAQVGPKIGPCAFSTLAASQQWLETDTAKVFMRAYRNTREYLNEAPAEQISADIQSFFPDIKTGALSQCIAAYQTLGCWTPASEISREAYEVTLDVFEHAGVLSERYDYDQICCLPPGENH
jgi:NitT/TauT family transport system substrate-binding protein